MELEVSLEDLLKDTKSSSLSFPTASCVMVTPKFPKEKKENSSQKDPLAYIKIVRPLFRPFDIRTTSGLLSKITISEDSVNFPDN